MKHLLKVYSYVMVLTLALVLWPVGAAEAANCLKVVKNLTITNTTGATLNVTLCPGTYHLADNDTNGVIIIKGSNITLDAGGVKLVGSNSSGYGVYLNGSSVAGGQITNVTIKNFSQISGFSYGMRLENASDLLIQKNVVSGNRKTDNYWLNINNGDPITTEGGGILLNNVSNSTIGETLSVSKPTSAPQDWVVTSSTTGLYNTFQNENSGVEILNGTQNNVAGNVASSNKAWGIRLYNSTGNLLYN